MKRLIFFSLCALAIVLVIAAQDNEGTLSAATPALSTNPDTTLTIDDNAIIEPDEVELQAGASFVPGRLQMPVNIIIDKRKTRLLVVNAFGDTLATYPVCCSRNRGQKTKSGDCRTPEGTFSIIGVYNSTDWRYKGTGAKCYGPNFIHLNTPGFYGIGIHGTNAPGSVPGRYSHGCIRMHNEDIVKVKSMVTHDTKVTILPDDERQEAKQIEQIRREYVPKGTVTDTKVSEEDVEAHKRLMEPLTADPQAVVEESAE